ncbi:hypothetical protein Patl1_13790 [Pistacia atlantica]|uniref:Uncharacterized protein n=1 Tax=Pistacia atlantica TaxID=434234 RepID=A0ACC1AUJ0_9ROSI|nr:hypothetical protein Patl1_13790 [Pistacia atlantica]
MYVHTIDSNVELTVIEYSLPDFNMNGNCGQIVRTLPGYAGSLPFKLETGYVSVGDSELFYLFVESQGNPEVDPVLFYVVGGPGCSALNGFFFQTGPLQFTQTDYTGGLPSLHLYPYTWTKTASVIFVDSPVGSGYSYASTAPGFVLSDSKFANQTYNFMRSWLNEHPQYIPNRVVLATDSYSGIIAPIVVQKLLEDNKAGVEPSISILGYISGSPHSDLELEDNDKIPQAHQLGLISKAVYESAKHYCNGSYVDKGTTTISADCEEYLEITDNNFAYLLLTIWANDKAVQSALHVREETIQEWRRCNLTLKTTYDIDIGNNFDYHKNLTKTGIQVLLYG